MFWAGMMGFLAAGGPVWLFAALAQSFGTGVLNGGAVSEQSLLSLGGVIFSGAVSLAMPVLAVALSVNLTVGLLSVFAPQLNVLSIGFPLLILAGFWMLAGSTPYLGGEFAQLMRVGLNATAQLLHG